MRYLDKSFYSQKIVVLFLLLLFESCETGPSVGLYKFAWTYDDGERPFEIYRPDFSLIDTTHIPGTPFYDAGTHNLWCRDSTKLRMSHEGDLSDDFKYIFPLYVHRPFSRTDTLFMGYYRTRMTLPFGHIHRECFMDRWIILECRLPGRILGYTHLFDEAYRKIPIDNLCERSYTYEGQRLIFESDNFDYWVINRMTTDLYGPLTEKELVKQLKILNVPLPVKLKSSSFPYQKNYKDGRFIEFPDSLYSHGILGRHFPHGKKVKSKIIG